MTTTIQAADLIESIAAALQYISYYNEERIKTKLKTSPVSFRLREAAA